MKECNKKVLYSSLNQNPFNKIKEVPLPISKEKIERKNQNQILILNRGENRRFGDELQSNGNITEVLSHKNILNKKINRDVTKSKKKKKTSKISIIKRSKGLMINSFFRIKENPTKELGDSLSKIRNEKINLNFNFTNNINKNIFQITKMPKRSINITSTKHLTMTLNRRETSSINKYMNTSCNTNNGSFSKGKKKDKDNSSKIINLDENKMEFDKCFSFGNKVNINKINMNNNKINQYNKIYNEESNSTIFNYSTNGIFTAGNFCSSVNITSFNSLKLNIVTHKSSGGFSLDNVKEHPQMMRLVSQESNQLQILNQNENKNKGKPKESLIKSKSNPANPFKLSFYSESKSTSKSKENSINILKNSLKLKTKNNTPIKTEFLKDNNFISYSFNSNPQIPLEYIDEIFSFLKSIESEDLPIQGYMNIIQTDINERMRMILLDWLIDVHLKFSLLSETLFMTVNIIDRYLSKKDISRKYLQLLGITALLIAGKYEENNAPKIFELIFMTDNAYTHDDVIKMESDIVSILNFNLSYPTSIRFLEIFQNKLKLDEKDYKKCQYFIELFLLDYQSCHYKPSIVAASSMLFLLFYLEKKIGENLNYNNYYQYDVKKIFEITGYNEEDLFSCFLCLNKAIQKIEKLENNFISIRRKYLLPKLMEVSIENYYIEEEKIKKIYEKWFRKDN